MKPPRRLRRRYSPWTSYGVLISLWTDPQFLRRRFRRLVGRLSRSGSTRVFGSATRPPAPGVSARPRISRSAGTDLTASPLTGLDVDLVYLWVRGQDPIHREKRNYWLRKFGLDPVVSNPDVRYIEVDELRYSLRTVELFLPWVRRVFIVTDNQIPEWLNLAHPKIQIIDHTEIMTDPQWLPTFNSFALEAQLHTIPGLSEHFIACNDDHFFGQPCRIDDFFTRLSEPAGGVGMKVMLSESDDDWIIPAHQVTHDPLAQLWMAAWNNVKVALELRQPWRKVRYLDIHQVQPMTKSALRRASREFARAHQRTCGSKFRDANDIFFLALAKYHSLANKTGVTGWLPNKVFRYESDLRPYSRSNLPTLFCINGGPVGGTAPDEKFLESLFPRASSFEIDDTAL